MNVTTPLCNELSLLQKSKKSFVFHDVFLKQNILYKKYKYIKALINISNSTGSINIIINIY